MIPYTIFAVGFVLGFCALGVTREICDSIAIRKYNRWQSEIRKGKKYERPRY
jgi:allophanate hydrolase subunit 1